MNYLTYPLKKMNITQGYSDNYSHKQHNTGEPKDYPIDDNGGTSKKEAYFYCPCDEMVVKKIYGVGTNVGNTLWLESTSLVITPTFTDYVTIIIVHPNDSDFKNLKVGQKFKRGDKIVEEGDDGKATGYHFHISVGRGKLIGTGWIKNSNGIWVIRTNNGAVKPEEAFFIDPNFTQVLTTKGIPFVKLYEDKEEEDNYWYVTESLNVRIGPGTNYKCINSLPKNTEVKILETVGTWAKISDKEWVSKNFLTKTKPSKIYKTLKTTATSLNVRKSPNGKILSTKAPLMQNTTVAIMTTRGNWVKINTDRWVYRSYLA